MKSTSIFFNCIILIQWVAFSPAGFAQLTANHTLKIDRFVVEINQPSDCLASEMNSHPSSELQEARLKWQKATNRKWLGYGIGLISSIVMINQGPTVVSFGGYIAGGVLGLIGNVGEDVNKHRFARALTHEMRLVTESSAAASIDVDDEKWDVLLPPLSYRACTLEDLKTGVSVWFKQGDSPVLAIGRIETTSSRGSRVYVTVSSEGKEQTLPMGDIYIPL
jgi:hypothetical protein